MNRLIRTTAIGAGALAAVVAATPTAQAATSDPALTAQASRGGACSGYSDARWDRASDTVTINSRVHSAYAFAACRLRVVVTWHAGTYTVGQATHDLPTACALTDPTCPSTVYDTWSQAGNVAFFAVPYVDGITAELQQR